MYPYISKSEPWVKYVLSTMPVCGICAWPRCSCPPAGQERKWGWNIHYCCTTAGIMLKLLIDPNWLLKCFVWNWVAEVQGEQKIYIYIYSMGSRNGFIGMYHIFIMWFVLLQTPSRGDSWLETPWQHWITSITAVVITTCALWSYFMFICACCQASQLIFRNVLTTLSSPVLPSGPPNLPIFIFFLLRHSDKPLVFAGDVISTWPFNAAATRGRTWLINSGRQKDEAARGGRRACVETQGKADTSWGESLSAARPTRRDHMFTSEALLHLLETLEDWQRKTFYFGTSVSCLHDVGSRHFC